MTPDLAEWGKRVRAARLAAELTQEQLAERTGVSQPKVSNIELGEGASDPMKARIAAALGVPVPDLFPWPTEVAS